jgi:hypothetical protein
MRSKYARLGVLLSLLQPACGNTSSAEAPSDAEGDASSDAADCVLTGVSRPPAPPTSADVPDPGAPSVFAVSRLRLGLYNADGTYSNDAWRSLGFDLDCDDGSAAGGPALCTLYDPTKPEARANGLASRDNSFGHNVAPFINGLTSTFETAQNSAIADGSWSLLLSIASGTGQMDDAVVPGTIYVAAPLGTQPKFDGTDVWSPTAESFSAPGVARASVVGYLAAGTWVARHLELEVPVSPAEPYPYLHVLDATVSVDLTADRSAGTNGVIAGVIDPTEFFDSFIEAKAAGDPTKCAAPPNSPDLRAWSDQPATGASGGTCSRISFGAAFEVRRVELGPVASPNPRPAPVCH